MFWLSPPEPKSCHVLVYNNTHKHMPCLGLGAWLWRRWRMMMNERKCVSVSPSGLHWLTTNWISRQGGWALLRCCCCCWVHQIARRCCAASSGAGGSQSAGRTVAVAKATREQPSRASDGLDGLANWGFTTSPALLSSLSSGSRLRPSHLSLSLPFPLQDCSQDTCKC